MAHYLVDLLRFTRGEFVRGLGGVGDEEAQRRFGPMNCVSWMSGHVANQENAYWVLVAQGKSLAPGLNDLVGYGKPASAPPLAEMWSIWREITGAADAYLDTLTESSMTEHLLWKGEPRPEAIGTMLMRNVLHYWYHLGEGMAVRQMLGHTGLPDFVGPFGPAVYRHESA